MIPIRRLSAVSCIALLLAATGAQAQIAAYFGEDAEGWFVRDLSCSNYNSIVATHQPAWHGADGDPGGYVSHHDATNQCAFFVAPATWLGDRSEYAGGSLTFSLTSTERARPVPAALAFFTGESQFVEPTGAIAAAAVQRSAKCQIASRAGGRVSPRSAFMTDR